MVPGRVAAVNPHAAVTRAPMETPMAASNDKPAPKEEAQPVDDEFTDKVKVEEERYDPFVSRFTGAPDFERLSSKRHPRGQSRRPDRG